MRPFALILLAALVAACTPTDSPTPATPSGENANASTSMSDQSLPTGAVRHVVVFRFTPEATDTAIAEVTRAFRELETRIPGIIGFEDGVNNSPEGLNDGFTHVFTVTFEDVAARDAYLPHPEHAAFGALLDSLGIVDGVFVVDYLPNS